MQDAFGRPDEEHKEFNDWARRQPFVSAAVAKNRQRYVGKFQVPQVTVAEGLSDQFNLYCSHYLLWSPIGAFTGANIGQGETHMTCMHCCMKCDATMFSATGRYLGTMDISKLSYANVPNARERGLYIVNKWRWLLLV